MDLVHDPRLSLMTSADVIEDGVQIKDFIELER